MGWDRKKTLVLFFAGLAAFIFLLRLPSFSNSFCDPDLGTPAYTSRLLMAGQCPYSHAIISKPPGTVLLYALLFRVFGLNMIPVYSLSALLALACAVTLFFIGRRAVGESAGYIAAGLYGLYQADLMSNGACPNFESWVIFPAVLSLAMLTAPELKARHIVAAGAFTAVAFWMKQTAVSFALATAAVAFYRSLFPRPYKIGRALKSQAWLALGVAAGSAPFLAAMGSVSCLSPMMKALNPLAAAGYLRSFDETIRAFVGFNRALEFLKTDTVISAVVYLGLLSILSWNRYEWKPTRRIVVIFLAAAGLSLFSGSHFFNHYFVVLFPFLCLFAGLMLGALWNERKRLYRAAVIASLAACVLIDGRPQLTLAGMSISSLARNSTVLSKEIFLKNRFQELLPGETCLFLGQEEWALSFRQIARVLRGRIDEGDTIWTLDYLPEFYFYLRTFAPTRHQENFEFVTAVNSRLFGLWHKEVDDAVRRNRAELMTDLAARPPRYIIRLAHECKRNYNPFALPDDWPRNIYGEQMAARQPKVEAFPALDQFIETHYRQVGDLPNDTLLVYEYQKGT